MSAPRDDEEWRKMITSSLIGGPSIIVIDNVDGILRSSSLSRALTAKVWRDRILGRSEMIDLPQRAVWYATGNNIQIKGDLARRSILIRLDAEMARPWLRSEFKHEDLLGWVKDNRAKILSSLLTIVRAWFVAGQPPAQVRPLGGFDDWVQKVGGVLELAGLSGFLGNKTELYDSMDQEVGQWDGFLIVWREVKADHPITSAELKKDLESTDEIYKDLQAAMPDDIARAISKSAKSAGALGNVLSKHVDQVYPAGLKLIREEEKHQKIKKWRVIDTVQSAGTDKKAKSTTIDDFAGVAGTREHLSIAEKKVSTNVEYIERPELPPAAPANVSNASVSSFSEYPPNKSVNGEAIKSNNPGIREQIRRGEERAREKEEHFSKLAESYIDENEDEATEQSKADRVRITCILEYGMNGWVDPLVVAHKLDVPIDDVVTWLESAANYVRKDKPGIIGYVQRVTEPKEEVNDRNKPIHGTSSSSESEYVVDEGVCSNEN